MTWQWSGTRQREEARPGRRLARELVVRARATDMRKVNVPLWALLIDAPALDLVVLFRLNGELRKGYPSVVVQPGASITQRQMFAGGR